MRLNELIALLGNALSDYGNVPVFVDLPKETDGYVRTRRVFVQEAYRASDGYVTTDTAEGEELGEYGIVILV